MEQQSVKLHETNEGRETQQGIAGFEGMNALYFMVALGMSMLLFRRYASGQDASMMLAIGLASIPLIVVSAYCFGLKQGKPPSYDVELAEWLIIKASKGPYFDPSKVEPMALPWVEGTAKEQQS